MKKSLFILLFVSVVFITATANAAAVSKIEKNVLMRPTESNVEAYIQATHGVKHKRGIVGTYAVVASKDTAKIKAVRNIVMFFKKLGYYNIFKVFRKITSKKERIKLTKRIGTPIVIGIPQKNFKSEYKKGFINKNVLIANEGVNIKPKAIKLIHLLMKNGYNVGIATISPARNKFWGIKNVSSPYITIVP